MKHRLLKKMLLVFSSAFLTAQAGAGPCSIPAYETITGIKILNIKNAEKIATQIRDEDKSRWFGACFHIEVTPTSLEIYAIRAYNRRYAGLDWPKRHCQISVEELYRSELIQQLKEEGAMIDITDTILYAQRC